MTKNKKMLVIYIVSFLIFPPVITLILCMIQGLGNLAGVSLITEKSGTVIINVVLNMFLFLTFFKNYRNEVKQDWDRTKRHIAKRVIFYGMIMLIMAGIISGIFSALGVETSENQKIIKEMFAADKILGFIMVSVLAPFAEEIVFRYIIMNFFEDKKKYSGLLLSSVLFGIWHLSVGELNVLAVMFYFMIGLLLGVTYLRTKSIITNYAIHSFYNLMAAMSMVELYLL